MRMVISSMVLQNTSNPIVNLIVGYFISDYFPCPKNLIDSHDNIVKTLQCMIPLYVVHFRLVLTQAHSYTTPHIIVTRFSMLPQEKYQRHQRDRFGFGTRGRAIVVDP